MQVKDLFRTNNSIKIFRIIEKELDDYEDYDDIGEWLIEATNFEIIPKGEGDLIVAAKQVYANKIVDCYMNLNMPERLSDYVIWEENGKVIFTYIHKFPAHIMPASASDGYGNYNIYYAKQNPQIGIDILKAGLEKSQLKNAIANDLYYILRDEKRYKEALEYLLIADQTGSSATDSFYEMIVLYKELGLVEKQKEYELKFEAYRNASEI